MISRSAAILALLLGTALPAQAQQPMPDDDDAEVVAWQTVKDSRNPKDLQTFLLLYPRGKLSSLARIKLARLGGHAVAQADPVEDAAPALPVLYHLDVSPGVVGMGQTVTVKCRGFMAPALYDHLVVARVGAPDFDPSGKLDRGSLLWDGLVNLYDCAGTGIQLPMMMKGSYEVRYVSRQYNPDGSKEVVARSGFVYR